MIQHGTSTHSISSMVWAFGVFGFRGLWFNGLELKGFRMEGFKVRGSPISKTSLNLSAAEARRPADANPT